MKHAPWILAMVAATAIASDDYATVPAAGSAYATECGSCHVPYPPRMLAPTQWTAVLGSLDRHYGVDASLDAATLAAVAGQLRIPAGNGAGRAGTVTNLPRITRSAWFREEHDEVASRTWSSPAVKSPANCGACHQGAERGSFDEHSVRLPK